MLEGAFMTVLIAAALAISCLSLYVVHGLFREQR